MSFICNSNIIDHRTDPCGSPEVTSTLLELALLATCLSMARKKSAYPTKCVISNAIVV